MQTLLSHSAPSPAWSRLPYVVHADQRHDEQLDGSDVQSYPTDATIRTSLQLDRHTDPREILHRHDHGRNQCRNDPIGLQACQLREGATVQRDPPVAGVQPPKDCLRVNVPVATPEHDDYDRVAPPLDRQNETLPRIRTRARLDADDVGSTDQEVRIRDGDRAGTRPAHRNHRTLGVDDDSQRRVGQKCSRSDGEIAGRRDLPGSITPVRRQKTRTRHTQTACFLVHGSDEGLAWIDCASSQPLSSHARERQRGIARGRDERRGQKIVHADPISREQSGVAVHRWVDQISFLDGDPVGQVENRPRHQRCHHFRGAGRREWLVRSQTPQFHASRYIDCDDRPRAHGRAGGVGRHGLQLYRLALSDRRPYRFDGYRGRNQRRRHQDDSEEPPANLARGGGTAIRYPAKVSVPKEVVVETSRSRTLRASVENAVEYLPVESLETMAQRLGVPPEEIAKLDANENPFGPPPAVVAALASVTDLHLYPDPDQRRARRALSDYTGAPVERILLGNGSDELLDLILLATIEPGDEVLVPVPSFGVYLSRPPLFGARVVTVPRTASFDLDLEALEQSISPRTKLLFLASPNNPTGNLVTADELERLARTGILVVVDEAYYEFAGTTLQAFTERYDNVILLRTFSKWAGLAGLRIGYGIFPPAIARAIWRVKQPFNVNAVAQVAVEAALADREWLMERVSVLRRERERLYHGLQRFPFLQPYPSHANFVLCRVHDGRAHELHAHLLRAAIVVRRYDDEWLRDYLRITVGTPEQVDRVLAALETFPA